MKKQNKTKSDFSKTSIIELNDTFLLKIKGGDNDNNGTGDPHETTKTSINGDAVSSIRW